MAKSTLAANIAIVCLNALFLKIRQDGQVRNVAVNPRLGWPKW